MSPADQVLFDQWLTRRDASAFTRLAEKYAAMVYAVGRRITGNPHDAEDVAQAAFEALASQRCAPRVHLGAWLHRVATYRALTHLKAQCRRVDRETRYDRERPKHTEIGWDDIYELVDEAIAALPEKQRVVVVAHYLEGQTHDAIARELGISRSAVTQRVHAGVAGIRTALGKRGVAVPLAALGVLLANGAEAAAPIALVAQLGKIALSGYVGKSGAGIGLWQGMMAGLGTAKGMATVALVVVAATVGLVNLGLKDWREGMAAAVLGSPVEAAPPSQPAAVEGPVADENAVAAIASISAEPTTTFAANLKGARVYGKVVDTDGNPVPGAQVRLRETEDLQRGAGSVSDEEGAFEFSSVVPVETGWVGADKQQDDHELRSEQAELKPVLPGESYEVTLTLYDGVIAGRVLDEHARPMPGVEVLANPQWWYRFGLPTAQTNEEGRYHIAGVMAGEYEMQIKPGNGSHVATGVKVRSDGIGVRSEVNLTYRAPTGGVLQGRVTNEDGDAIPRAYVHMNLTVPPHTSQWTFSDAEGYYEIMGMPEGPNVVGASHFDYGDSGARNVTLDDDPVDFVLPRRGTVIGRVVHAETGEAIPAFEILTWESSSDIHYYMGSEHWKAHTQPEGRFSIVLKPGDQPLRVRAAGYGETNTSVTVPKGGLSEEVLVALKPSLGIRGRVVDATTSAPVVGARIYRGAIPSEALQSSRALTHSDEDGAFTLEDGLPDGESLAATHPSYAPAWITSAPGESDVILAMTPGVTVTGFVTINGEPAEGVGVYATAPHRTDSALAQATTDAEGRFALAGLPEKDTVLYAKLGSPLAPQDRSMYFQPDDAWRARREPIHFDFIQSRAHLLVTMSKGLEPQPGIMVHASQELGNGYTDSLEVFTDAKGHALFENLSEGSWALMVYGTNNTTIPMTASLKSDQMLMLQRDLEQPDIEMENVASYPHPDAEANGEKPKDGEQFQAPLIEEIRGDGDEAPTGPS